MKRFRTIANLLVAGLLLGGLVACGGNAARSVRNGSATERSADKGSAAAPAGSKEKERKGRIITLSDKMLTEGGTDTLRFGHLGSGEIAVQRFWIENASAKPVVLVSTQRSCGCVSIDYDPQPIAPATSRKMEITFDSRGEYGWQLKRMDLFFSGAPKPIRLFIEADIE